MLDSSKLAQLRAKQGNRYTCYQCGTKFYDLNRPAAICPECGADQADAPVRDIKSLLSRNGAPIRKEVAPEPGPEKAADEEGTEEDSFDDSDVDLGLGDLDEGDDDFGLMDEPPEPTGADE